MESAEDFRDAVRRLHRAKDAAYRNAWKKRGELIGIMANIARKVDRLENIAQGAPATADEPLLDTAVDLLVYTLKYQTYLADQDASIASIWFKDSGVTPPYSDGPDGFDVLLAHQDMRHLSDPLGPGTGEATGMVIAAFAELEACFQSSPEPAQRRSAIARVLADASVSLAGSLLRAAPQRYRDSFFTDSKGDL